MAKKVKYMNVYSMVDDDSLCKRGDDCPSIDIPNVSEKTIKKVDEVKRMIHEAYLTREGIMDEVYFIATLKFLLLGYYEPEIRHTAECCEYDDAVELLNNI